jgi:hypothetical protein
MRVEAGRDHVRPLLLHQLLPLRKAAVGDAVLDDRVALACDAVAQPLPAGNVEIAELGAVGLDFSVDGIRSMQMADRGAGIDRADIFLSDRIDAARRRIIGIRRIRHRRIAGDGHDQFLH